MLSPREFTEGQGFNIKKNTNKKTILRLEKTTPNRNVLCQDNSANSANEGTTAVLNLNDVLCGRGSRTTKYPGNVQLRSKIAAAKVEYSDEFTTKKEKTVICAQIIADIRSLNPPGRFLEFDATRNLWIDIGDERARRKVGQCFRELNVKSRREIQKKHELSPRTISGKSKNVSDLPDLKKFHLLNLDDSDTKGSAYYRGSEKRRLSKVDGAVLHMKLKRRPAIAHVAISEAYFSENLGECNRNARAESDIKTFIAPNRYKKRTSSCSFFPRGSILSIAETMGMATEEDEGLLDYEVFQPTLPLKRTSSNSLFSRSSIVSLLSAAEYSAVFDFVS